MSAPVNSYQAAVGEFNYAVVTRPNGKVYRARKAPTVIGFYDESRDVNWVAVLRTHDEAFARTVARPFVCNGIDIANPDLGWIRKTIRDHELFWDHDDVSGMPCVLFMEYDA